MPPSLPVPSTVALKVLRRLAFAGSTVGAIGGVCGIAATTYETHRRICTVEKIVEQKRKIHAHPRYCGSAAMLAVMMEMAENGTFEGKDSLPRRKQGDVAVQKEPNEVESRAAEKPELAEWTVRWRLLRDKNSDQARILDTGVDDKIKGLIGKQGHRGTIPDQISPHEILPSAGARDIVRWRSLLNIADTQVESTELPIEEISECSTPNMTWHSSAGVAPLARREVPLPTPNQSVYVAPEVSLHRPDSKISSDYTSRHAKHVQSVERNLSNLLLQLPAWNPSDEAILTFLKSSNYSGALREFWSTRKVSEGCISKSVRRAVFYAALLVPDLQRAETILEELDREDHALSASCNALILSHQVAKNEEKMAETYLQYSHNLQLLPSLYMPLMKALLNSKQFVAAENLMENALQQQLSNPRLPELAASFLSKLWVNSQNLGRVQLQFERLSAWGKGNLIGFKIYNSIIQACVEANDEIRAHRYYEDMKARLGHNGDIRTGLLLLELDASKDNWTAVESGLCELHKNGLTLANPDIFTRSFTRILTTFKMNHRVHEVRRFIYDAVDLYGLVPDQFLSNEYLATCARDGNLDLVVDWFNLSSEKGWGIAFNSKTFAMMFEWYWRGTEIPYEQLCVLLQTCVKLLGASGFGHRGQRLLSHDVIDTVREAVMWSHRHAKRDLKQTKWMTQKLSFIESDYTDSNRVFWKDWRRDPDQLRKKLLYETSRGNNLRAVECYRQARLAGGLIKRIHLQIAVQASIKASGSAHEATQLIREAVEVRGSQTVSGEVLYHNLQTWEPWQGFEKLRDTIRHHYSTLEKDRMPIDHRIIVAAADRLLEFHLAHHAIDLLMWMHNSRWCKRSPLDIIPMTVLLRAYIMNGQNGNLHGVEWVINHVLDQKMAVDGEFYYQVWLARRDLVWKKMTERQICGADPMPTHLRRWSLALDIWVRDVKLREKQVEHEKYQRGFDLIKLANEYGGFGAEARRQRKVEEVLNYPTGATWAEFMHPQTILDPAPLSTRLIEE
jgi:pentatricopeptide repeat protein